MSKNNNEFFKVKKEWSKVKDELLMCYLKPYIQKVLYTNRPITYVDCFAGKGKFEDESLGSPLIALDIFQTCVKQTSVTEFQINPFFIELNYSEELRHNLCEYKVLECAVIEGKFEEKIDSILNGASGHNVFLYIDPYGIKELNYNELCSYSTDNKFYSIEILLNLNSFGFIREGCRVMGIKKINIDLDELHEYENTRLEENHESVQLLNKVAGGDYWQSIINQINTGQVDSKEAEKIFAKEYCKRLSQYYKYVLNMPIRIKKNHPTKYRMIHMTNHIEGCLLMVDNIWNRWPVLKRIQEGNQESLFMEDLDNNIINENELKQFVIEHLTKYKRPERLDNLMVDFFIEYGPVCNTQFLKRIFKELERQGKLDVYRFPAVTATGKKSTFYDCKKGKSVELRWKNENDN